MDKKTAFILLLENSLMIPDRDKIRLLKELPGLTDEQIEALGRLLAREHRELAGNKEQILKNSKLLLDTLRAVTA